ncbi:glycosyl hydrolase family 8 [Fibrobacter sp. UBA4297]|uniref:glycosyl hydrolase family 8 n=1 Tax=Fibrobacter sp. UBA4297 TaxID=1946536 RepID=UPI0025B9100F|nr:glycosyl hydrolase family 8 [Fibrobacter sp. UBA4297]
MVYKKILLPILIGSAFFLGACGDDAATAPANPTPSSAFVPLPVLSSSSVYIPLPTSSAPTPASSATPTPTPTPTPGTYASLAATANPAFAANIYTLWKSFHFVTEEQEMSTYPELAAEFNVVFPIAYMPAGRVIWSSQTGYYKPYCSATTAVSNMKTRACTVSEGIGYGMLLAYFNNDDDTFARLWNYTRAYREYSNRKLMPWITQSFHWTEVDNSSATDADEDIATALILMYFKSGNALYLQDALTFMNAIWDLEVNPANLLIYSGDEDVWKLPTPVYNLSYFSPVALRLFAMVDPNPAHNWKGVLDAMYAYTQKVQSLGTGVFPDWSDDAGMAAKPSNGSANNTYWTFNKESVRIPWRLAWDYYWYQDTRAAAILNQLNSFITTKAPSGPDDKALAINYSWNLSVGKDYTNNTAVPSQWYAAWCATGIAGNATWLATCTNGMNTTRMPSNTNASYFSDILLTMYSALLNGLFVRPAGI